MHKKIVWLGFLEGLFCSGGGGGEGGGVLGVKFPLPKTC